MPQLLIDTDSRSVTIPGPPSLWVPPDLHASAIELLIETVPHAGGPDFAERILTALARQAVAIADDGPPPEMTLYEVLLNTIHALHAAGGLREFAQRPKADGSSGQG